MVRPSEKFRISLTAAPDEELTPRRHHRASELRLPAQGPIHAPGPGTLSAELRASLWSLIVSFVFTPSPDRDRWTSGIIGRPVVRRIWGSPPLSGDPATLTESMIPTLETWFSLVEAADVFELIASVHDNLEIVDQTSFAAACNAILERGMSDHRFVMRRLIPISSRADVGTIERALVAARSAKAMASEDGLLAALDCLALKPAPDYRGAILAGIRAVESMATALGREPQANLDDTLEDLHATGYIDGARRSAYRGLLGYAKDIGRASAEDARLIVVMCAGFVSHLASRAPSSANRSVL